MYIAICTSTQRTDMRNQPIRLQFIMPKAATPSTRKNYCNLRKLISQKNTIHLQLTPSSENEGEFYARILFKEEETAFNTIAEMQDSDLATEAEVLLAINNFKQNPLSKSMRPAQCVYAVMSNLEKPVQLQILCKVCYEVLGLRPETIRGTLNKKRMLYLSPRHGIWCTVEFAERMGWGDCR